MDDDLRNRFRSPRRSYDAPSYSRPTPPPNRPAPPPVSTPAPPPSPKPVPRPVTPSQPEQSWADVMSDSQPEQKPKKPNKQKKKRGKRSKKPWLIPLILLVLAGACFFAYKKYKTSQANATPEAQSAQQQPAVDAPTGSIRMMATGDNLAFDSINTAAKTATGYDYLPMMENFKPLLAKADIRLCNETTIGGGEPLGISGYPLFNAPTAWSAGFAGLGCNLMNLGSDHTNDRGQPGIDVMASTWKNQTGILAYAGANSSAEEQAQIRYFTAKQVKFAYLSYTTRTVKADNTPYGINLYNADLAAKQIAEARKNAKLVLVSITWGNEDQTAISGDQDRIAQELATAGADVVIGGGTHVVQPAKILDGKDSHQTLVWFSLGNFINSQLPINNLIGGMAVMDFDATTGQLRDPKLLPTYMHYDWTAAQKAAGTVNARTNFKIYPLDQATEQLANSQNKTTVAEQTARVNGIITQFAPIKVITSAEL